MTDQSAKNTRVSWQTMQGCSVFLLYISRPDIESVIILICLTVMLISMGISPLFVENKPVSVLMASMLMIALGGGIGGLTIGTLLERLFAESRIEIGGSWVASVALICTSLGVLVWVFIVLRISPVTRPPLVAAMLFAIAGAYSLIYGILTLETYFFGIIRIASPWGEGIAYILNGGAIVGWSHLVMPKILITKMLITKHGTLKVCSMIVGVATIVIGVASILDAIF